MRQPKAAAGLPWGWVSLLLVVLLMFAASKWSSLDLIMYSASMGHKPVAVERLEDVRLRSECRPAGASMRPAAPAQRHCSTPALPAPLSQILKSLQSPSPNHLIQSKSKLNLGAHPPLWVCCPAGGPVEKQGLLDYRYADIFGDTGPAPRDPNNWKERQYQEHVRQISSRFTGGKVPNTHALRRFLLCPVWVVSHWLSAESGGSAAHRCVLLCCALDALPFLSLSQAPAPSLLMPALLAVRDVDRGSNAGLLWGAGRRSCKGLPGQG